MIVKKLALTNFKNYSSGTLICADKFTCLLGKNGMGKTNLLDALHYIGLCQSHFSITDSQLALKGTDFFRLEVLVNKQTQSNKLVAKVKPGKKKTFEKDGKAYDRLSDYLGQLPMVMIAPDDTIIGTGGSEERRKIMDETLCQTNINYLRALILYNKLLKQRNAALKQMAKLRSWDHELLNVYDAQMSEPAQLIFKEREDWLSTFKLAFEEFYEDISKGEEMPEIDYKSQLFEFEFAEGIVSARDKDIILQRTTIGIHKDDLIFKLKGMPLKRFGSQGQLKSFIMALKLAQYDCLNNGVEEKPLLLLDDIFDKLDQHRVGELIKLLSTDKFGQIFISDTDLERLPSILHAQDQALFYLIEEGTITAIK